MSAPPGLCANPPPSGAVQARMEREEDFEAGDRNSGNGNRREQMEASAQVFEDGQIRDTSGPVRQEKDGESYVYGDSRPDRTQASDAFTDISDSPMMNTTREGLPEAHRLSEDELRATSHGADDEIRPKYNPIDDSEGQVIVHKESV